MECVCFYLAFQEEFRNITAKKLIQFSPKHKTWNKRKMLQAHCCKYFLECNWARGSGSIMTTGHVYFCICKYHLFVLVHTYGMFHNSICDARVFTKGQLSSEWIYEVIVSPKMPTQNLKDFCPGSLLEGRAEILGIFWLAFWEKRWPHKFILNLTDL